MLSAVISLVTNGHRVRGKQVPQPLHIQQAKHILAINSYIPIYYSTIIIIIIGFLLFIV